MLQEKMSFDIQLVVSSSYKGCVIKVIFIFVRSYATFKITKNDFDGLTKEHAIFINGVEHRINSFDTVFDDKGYIASIGEPS